MLLAQVTANTKKKNIAATHSVTKVIAQRARRSFSRCLLTL